MKRASETGPHGEQASVTGGRDGEVRRQGVVGPGLRSNTEGGHAECTEEIPEVGHVRADPRASPREAHPDRRLSGLCACSAALRSAGGRDRRAPRRADMWGGGWDD